MGLCVFLLYAVLILIYRLLEKQLDEAGEHFTTANIIETLRNLNVTNVQDMYYIATCTGSKALQLLKTDFAKSVISHISVDYFFNRLYNHYVSTHH